MKPLFKHLAFLLLLLSSGTIQGQNFYKERISRDNILAIGIGPSFAYLDNGGQYRALSFAIKPSVSVGLTKRLSNSLDLRSTLGYQYISNGGNPSFAVRDMWYENYSSFTAKGPLYYFDVTPRIYLKGFSNHMHRSLFNLYGGVGLGILHSRTEQTKSFESEEIPTEHKITTGYVPVRAGLSYRLGPYSDIALEGTMMLTFTDNLDGNVGFNRFADHLFQTQLMYRMYFVPKNKD
ncbi:hypothetical protein J0A68_08405 [Algoriphagus sp. H41]|uniref:Outer membrane protein beta-barrel domain-containing protein n=1 Tax=Algoriphagus oliviformis TaxID=2811231 RepID=A0ABS3C1I7_9BACT|nr:hypothetical protein [Algoriphagus oliviformis]MBN7810973.1 hypothetical protein [Algoriphagus oliviformis]